MPSSRVVDATLRRRRTKEHGAQEVRSSPSASYRRHRRWAGAGNESRQRAETYQLTSTRAFQVYDVEEDTRDIFAAQKKMVNIQARIQKEAPGATFVLCLDTAKVIIIGPRV